MWKLGSGEEVVNSKNDHVSSHTSVLGLLPEVLGKIASSEEDFIVVSVDMEKIVGRSNCVVTNDTDEIVYAQRPRRDKPTRFVKNRNPEPCSEVTVILKKGNDGKYILITAFVGGHAEREPWDKGIQTSDERVRSEQFWSSHALVWGVEEVVGGSETSECPW